MGLLIFLITGSGTPARGATIAVTAIPPPAPLERTASASKAPRLTVARVKRLAYTRSQHASPRHCKLRPFSHRNRARAAPRNASGRSRDPHHRRTLATDVGQV